MSSADGYIQIDNNQIIPTSGSQGQIGNSTYYWSAIVSKQSLPAKNNTSGFNCGNSSYRWHEGWFETTYTVGGGEWDDYDDLALVKQWGEPNPVIPEEYDSSKIKPEKEPFEMFKEKEAGWFRLNDLVSFGLGCSKALAKKQDEFNDVMLALYDGIETLDEKMVRLEEENNVLKSKLAKMDDLEKRIVALEKIKNLSG